MPLPIDHTFRDEATAAWWETAPDLSASGTAFKSWIQTIPPTARRADREAAHAAVMEQVVPYHIMAQDLSYLCILRKTPLR